MKVSANGDQTQRLPYTEASLVYHLTEKINSLIAEYNKIPELASGTDLDNVTKSGTYVINGVGVVNAPPNWYVNYGTVYVTAINTNSCTQMLIDNRNNRFTRARYGQNKTWTSWKKFTQE